MSFDKRSFSTYLSTSVCAYALLAGSSGGAYAQTSPTAAATSAVEELVITGSRIVREGYEAPTPLTVVGTEALERSADSNVLTYLNSLPAMAGTNLTTNNSICTACGTAGLQGVNLRALGGNRALVLLDGRRVVGAAYDGTPDIGSFPQQLMSRVDVITGGASAVYGSDAVAGVVNFVLDRDFTGIKAEVAGGLTNYGDDQNFNVDISTGFAFGPDDRGHVLLSGQYKFNAGIDGDGGRGWNREGWSRITNPAYTATNGQPNQLWGPNRGLASATAGGIIVSGPLKGTVFGEGGAPFQYNYGLVSSIYSVGGDWRLGDMRPYADLDPRQEYESFFGRISYALAESVEAHVQYAWSQSHLSNVINYQWLLGNRTVRIDNAYMPASVRAAMVQNNITSFTMGTWSQDAGPFSADNVRIGNRVQAGLEGNFEALGSTWNWDATYTYGATDLNLHTVGSQVISLMQEAIDAVVHPTTGQIVCRSTLTNPGNGCRPWNIMGVNVNNEAPYFGRDSFQNSLVEQTTYSATLTGEPFSLWAGPVGLAVSFEHRQDEINSVVDQYSSTFDRPSGNFAALNGKQSVTEGALEALVPLAKGEAWAQDWDLSLAARFTDYELSGYVTTWKIGSTYSPSDDIRFRVTRSRDIRAPNLQELFANTNAIGAGTVNDPVLGTTYSLQFSLNGSNPNLLPEKADTTGIGVVFSPGFIDGFTASVDYWDVSIKGAIMPINNQQVIDSCYSGRRADLCANITRNAQNQITTVLEQPVNLALQNVRGLDIESSYRTPVSAIFSSMEGDLSIHGLMTFYLEAYQDNTFNEPTDRVGQQSDRNPPNWKFSVTASYDLDPLGLSVTGRGVSSGYLDSTYIECVTNCPTSTPAHLTINNNRMPSAFYLDASAKYKFDATDSASGEVFVSVKNILNRDPPPSVPTTFFGNQSSSAVAYDVLGTVFRAGVRFRM